VKRRTILSRVGALGTAGLAGCVSGADDGGASGGGGTTNETTTDSSMTPTLEGATIEVQANDCGQERSEATVSFAEDVTVEGTIWAPNPGWTAVLTDATYDADADELAVTVGVEEGDDDGPVVQCIAEIQYRATATFADGEPGSVTVTHETNDGTETVATTSRN
jgi:hypothetical protein